MDHGRAPGNACHRKISIFSFFFCEGTGAVKKNPEESKSLTYKCENS